MARIAVILSLLAISLSLSHAHRPLSLYEGGGAISSIAVPQEDADPASTAPLKLGDVEPDVGSDGSRHVALTLRRPRNSRCRHAVSLLLGYPQGRRIPGHFPGRRNFPARPQRLAGGAVNHGGLRRWIPGEEHVRLFRNAQEEAVREKKRFRKHEEEEEKAQQRGGTHPRRDDQEPDTRESQISNNVVLDPSFGCPLDARLNASTIQQELAAPFLEVTIPEIPALSPELPPSSVETAASSRQPLPSTPFSASPCPADARLYASVTLAAALAPVSSLDSPPSVPLECLKLLAVLTSRGSRDLSIPRLQHPKAISPQGGEDTVISVLAFPNAGSAGLINSSPRPLSSQSLLELQDWTVHARPVDPGDTSFSFSAQRFRDNPDWPASPASKRRNKAATAVLACQNLSEPDDLLADSPDSSSTPTSDVTLSFSSFASKTREESFSELRLFGSQFGQRLAKSAISREPIRDLPQEQEQLEVEGAPFIEVTRKKSKQARGKGAGDQIRTSPRIVKSNLKYI